MKAWKLYLHLSSTKIYNSTSLNQGSSNNSAAVNLHTKSILIIFVSMLKKLLHSSRLSSIIQASNYIFSGPSPIAILSTTPSSSKTSLIIRCALACSRRLYKNGPKTPHIPCRCTNLLYPLNRVASPEESRKLRTSSKIMQPSI